VVKKANKLTQSFLAMFTEPFHTSDSHHSFFTLSVHFPFSSLSFILPWSPFLSPPISDRSSVFTIELSSRREMCFGSDSSLWKGPHFASFPIEIRWLQPKSCSKRVLPLYLYSLLWQPHRQIYLSVQNVKIKYGVTNWETVKRIDAETIEVDGSLT
jgi:hypothetical protein